MIITYQPALLRAFSYLRPNFKSHPLNYVFMVLFFFLGFLPVSAFAQSDYWSRSGNYSSPEDFNATNPAGDFAMPKASCTSTGTNITGSNYGVSGGPTNTYCYASLVHVQCPVSAPFYSSSARVCVVDNPDPVVDKCPSDSLAVVSFTYYSSGYKATSFPETFNKDGCTYSVSAVQDTAGFAAMVEANPALDKNGSLTDCVVLVDGSDSKCMYTAIMKSMGNPPDTENSNVEIFDGTESRQTDLEADGWKTTEDSFKDYESSAVGAPTTSEVNGISFKTETSLTSFTKGSGLSLKKTDSKVVTLTRTDGIKQITTTTTTTQTNPDGSKKITENTNVTYTQTPVTTVSIKTNSNGTKTLTSGTTLSTSSGKNTTQTTNIGADGTATDSSSTTSGGCKAGTENCSDGIGDSGKCEGSALECSTVSVGANSLEGAGSWWETGYPDGIDGILAQYKLDIETELLASGMADVGVSGSGSNPAFRFDMNLGGGMNFGTHTIQVEDYVWRFIALCMYITTLWLCRALVFGG